MKTIALFAIPGMMTRSPAGAPRTAQLPRAPEARFLLRTSGTGGQRKRIALSDANLFVVLRSHLPILGLKARHRLLSTLPWSHAFGLVLESWRL
jgi:long-subunit acyl-CoA synthetase (AMP-forming)